MTTQEMLKALREGVTTGGRHYSDQYRAAEQQAVALALYRAVELVTCPDGEVAIQAAQAVALCVIAASVEGAT